jgi:hypothetical protein
VLESILSLMLFSLPVNWIETSHADFADGSVDPQMYVSHRAQYDPDSGCVEFFSRFDVDNNGYYDLGCSDDSGPWLRLYLGSSSGYTPTYRLLYPIRSGGNIELADLNLDGYAELVHSGWRSGRAVIYWGTSGGPSPYDTTSLSYSGQGEDVCVYDLDKDGYLDIIIGSSSGDLYIFWGAVDGYSSSRHSTVNLGYAIGHNIEVADYDRDGWGDLALSCWTYDQMPIVYWGPGRQPSRIVWLPGRWNNFHALSTADLDRNGWLDLVYTGYDTVVTSYIYWGTRNGFSDNNRTEIHPGQCYGGSAAVDWNRDGWLDIVYLRGNWTDGGMWKPRVYFNTGAPPYFVDSSYALLGTDTLNASGGFIGDFNFDGELDIFVNNMVKNDSSYVLWGPDYNRHTGLPVNNDHHGVFREPGNIYDRSPTATYFSSVYDAGANQHVTSATSSWISFEPPGSEVVLAYRSGDTPVPDEFWTGFFDVSGNGQPIPDAALGHRYLQYRITFRYARPCYLPLVERVNTVTVMIQDQHDVSTLAILSPGSLRVGDTVMPQAVVKNLGRYTENFPVVFRIGAVYADTVTVNGLRPDSQVAVGFRDWTAVLGTYAVACSTRLDGDNYPANDKAIDNWSVNPPDFLDVGAEQILAPAGMVDSGRVILPAARVRNFGNMPATFPVRFEIGGFYRDSLVMTLAAGEIDTVFFAAWSAAPLGTHAVKCSTMLAGDMNRANDRALGSVQVSSAVHDVACQVILDPRGTLDSGAAVTPAAVVRNLGGQAETFPVRFEIGGFYRDSLVTTLAGSATDTLFFAPWSAAPVGTQAVKCSTMLAGDMNPANDKALDSVTVRAPVRDVAVEAILAPVDTLDSAAVRVPAAIVRNLGTYPATFPVYFRIGIYYVDSTVATLGTGEADTVLFAAWSAAPRGTQLVKCTTALPGDVNPDNDARTATVTVRVRDVSALQILAPIGTLHPGDIVTPRAIVRNLGTTEESFPVVFRIGGAYGDVVTVDRLPPDSEQVVTFLDWTAVTGQYLVSCSTALANDMNPANDKTAESLHVVAREVPDVAVEEILNPVGTIDSGKTVVPAAIIRNLGTRTETFPVRFEIGGLYFDQQVITLNSNERDTVYFADWTAAPRGSQFVKCTTALDADSNPANNALATTVVVRVRDVGALQIITPVGRVHSDEWIAPQAQVRNFGMLTETFLAVFRIGAVYAESVTVLGLAPDSETVVSFPPWFAVLGNYATSCSTMSLPDMNPANDRVTGNIQVVMSSVVVQPDTLGAVLPAAAIRYRLRVRNRGSLPDTIDLTLAGTRPGWTAALLDSAGLLPLPDVNHNGLPDVGELLPGTTRWITVRVSSPSNALVGDEDTTVVTGRSSADSVMYDDAWVRTSVLPVTNIGVFPDEHSSTDPGVYVEYLITIQNLGNIRDIADLEVRDISDRPGWTYEVFDVLGHILPDQNRNGRPDLGPIYPLVGTAQVLLRVTPPLDAAAGESDTVEFWAYSGINPLSQDHVDVVTDVNGRLTLLLVAPDQTNHQTVGTVEDYSFFVQIQGNLGDTVELQAVAGRANWGTLLYTADLQTLLPDADRDGRPELGPVAPGVQRAFGLKVTAPDTFTGGLQGSIDSLGLCYINIIGQSSVNPTLLDTAVLTIQMVPGLEIHNFENPFRQSTRFVYGVPKPGYLRLIVYDRNGEVVRRVIDHQSCEPGIYTLPWDGRNDHQRQVAPGTYVYVFELTDLKDQTQRVMRKLTITGE